MPAFRAAMGERLAALEALRGRPLDAGSAAAAEVRRMAHALRGVGGTYGFPHVSQAAAACEDAPAGELAVRLDGLLAVLRRLAPDAPPTDRIVLLVEDDPAVLAVIQSALTAPDRRIRAVQTTAAAEVALADSEPDLILLDLVLPDADGRTLLRKLRASERTAQVPIVVLSALTSDRIREECLAAGADDYLLKPLDPSALRAAVAARMEGRRRPAAPPAPAAPNAAHRPAELAAAPAGAPEIPAASSRDAPAPGPILLAEDDELMASMVLHRLAREGLDVRRYANGAAALAAAQAESHALLLLDVKMPAMDGFELLERVRALPAYARTPILMLTSMGDERNIARGLALGADDYIVKPISPVELVARVKRNLRR